MAAKTFSFICGSDDFLVNRLAVARFEELARDAADEFSRETLSGFANNVGEVESAVNRFRDAVQTLGLFGGKKAVWLKDVNFLADSVVGRAEGTLKQVSDLQALLENINPDEVAVLITASPIDRRRSFPKWCETHSDFVLAAGDGRSGIDWRQLVNEECRQLGVSITDDAFELLQAKTNGNSRLLIEELRKLATYLDDPAGTIEETHVEEIVPAFGEGDFFEAAEAFFSRDLPWTLAAIHRHFFSGNDARPLFSALQNRNRLLIQLRVLVDAGEIRMTGRGIDKSSFGHTASAYREAFGDANAKSPFNIFTQNLWYLGKLAGRGLPVLKSLIDHQQAFVHSFEEIIRRPHDQEEVTRALAIRCLT